MTEEDRGGQEEGAIGRYDPDIHDPHLYAIARVYWRFLPGHDIPDLELCCTSDDDASVYLTRPLHVHDLALLTEEQEEVLLRAIHSGCEATNRSFTQGRELPTEQLIMAERATLARDILILAHQRLIPKIARELRYSEEEVYELWAEGYRGLIRAVEKYKPGKVKFTSYAHLWVEKYLREASINNGVKVTKEMKSVLNRVYKVIDERQKSGISPSQLFYEGEVIPQVMESLKDLKYGYLEEHVMAALYYVKNRMHDMRSLDKPVRAGTDITLGDMVPCGQSVESIVVHRVYLDTLFTRCGFSYREKQIAMMYFQSSDAGRARIREIAGAFQIDPSRIHDIISRLRTEIEHMRAVESGELETNEALRQERNRSIVRLEETYSSYDKLVSWILWNKGASSELSVEKRRMIIADIMSSIPPDQIDSYIHNVIISFSQDGLSSGVTRLARVLYSYDNENNHGFLKKIRQYVPLIDPRQYPVVSEKDEGGVIWTLLALSRRRYLKEYAGAFIDLREMTQESSTIERAGMACIARLYNEDVVSDSYTYRFIRPEHKAIFSLFCQGKSVREIYSTLDLEDSEPNYTAVRRILHQFSFHQPSDISNSDAAEQKFATQVEGWESRYAEVPELFIEAMSIAREIGLGTIIPEKRLQYVYKIMDSARTVLSTHSPKDSLERLAKRFRMSVPVIDSYFASAGLFSDLVNRYNNANESERERICQGLIYLRLTDFLVKKTKVQNK